MIDGPTAIMRLVNPGQVHGAFVLTVNNGLFDMNGFNQSMGGVNYFGGTIRQNDGTLTTFAQPFVMRDTYLEGPLQLGIGNLRFDATNGGTAVIDGNVNLSGGSRTFTIENGNALVTVQADQFAEDVVKLSPFQFGTLPLVNLQSHTLLGDALVENTEKYLWCERCSDQDTCEDQRNKTSVWATPVGNYS